MIKCGNLMGYMVGYFSMKIWVVSVRSWGDYQSGATLAFFASLGLMQNLRFSSPSLLLTLLQYPLNLYYPIGIFPSITQFLFFASCSAHLSAHCSKLHGWLSLFLFIWGMGEMRIELGDYFSTYRESSNKPKYFLWDLIGFLPSGHVWHCYRKWKF